jgi:peptidyl-prolyl cis-trans isomerase B (cyclophilin B)
MLADGTLPNDAAGGYTIFGKVTSGLDKIVSSIWDAGTKDGSDDGAPAVATTITAVSLD